MQRWLQTRKKRNVFFSHRPSGECTLFFFVKTQSHPRSPGKTFYTPHQVLLTHESSISHRLASHPSCDIYLLSIICWPFTRSNINAQLIWMTPYRHVRLWQSTYNNLRITPQHTILNITISTQYVQNKHWQIKILINYLWQTNLNIATST